MRRIDRLLAGWSGLARFWFGVLLTLGAVAVVLEALGPPAGPGNNVTGPMVRAGPFAGPHRAPDAGAAVRAERPGQMASGPIADPDPLLLEPYPDEANRWLPRIAGDGRASMAVYASGFDSGGGRPRVGMLVAGIGMSEADSLAAMNNLPNGVTLAFSPYAGNPGHLLEVARKTGHEYLLSIPMEPIGFPINDPDARHALMTSLPPAENLSRLLWILSRMAGYVGVTNALAPMRGDRLSWVPDQFGPVLDNAGHRGLLFVDVRVGQPVLSYAWNRVADVAIDDDPVDAATLDQRLDQLTRAALDKGSALGIVLIPRPVTLARVAAWTTTLAAKGLALTPVSALVVPPATQEAVK